MSLTPAEKVNELIRLIAVYTLIFLFFIINTMSFYTPLSTKIEVPLIMMVIYYWAIHRPTLIPPLLVFIMGACFDLLSAIPLGLSAFVFLIARYIISGQRVFLTGQPFAVIWLGYIIMSAGALLVQWFLFGLIHLNWLPIAPVLLMLGAGILIFPFMSLILNASHKILPESLLRM